jgi:hypothetical protein
MSKEPGADKRQKMIKPTQLGEALLRHAQPRIAAVTRPREAKLPGGPGSLSAHIGRVLQRYEAERRAQNTTAPAPTVRIEMLDDELQDPEDEWEVGTWARARLHDHPHTEIARLYISKAAKLGSRRMLCIQKDRLLKIGQDSFILLEPVEPHEKR